VISFCIAAIAALVPALRELEKSHRESHERTGQQLEQRLRFWNLIHGPA
jgi:hypothetical protein